jgi:hypothetical protein
VSNRFNRTYKRTLIVHLPEGYKFGNLDDLNIDVQYDKEGEKDMGFISTYKLEGDKLIVQCDEYYKTIAYPVDEYGNFEKVINAAADFNKVKIVLEKN